MTKRKTTTKRKTKQTLKNFRIKIVDDIHFRGTQLNFMSNLTNKQTLLVPNLGHKLSHHLFIGFFP